MTSATDSKDLADQVADLVQESRERGVEAADEQRRAASRETFQRRTALVIAILALILAINSLGASNASGAAVDANVRAANAYAFYQAKTIRQSVYRVAADELALSLPALPPEQRLEAQQRVDTYGATAERYESEPDPADPSNPLMGEGKRELLAQGQHWETLRERAQRQGPNFDYGGALLQIAIVLASVAVLATSRPVLGAALVAAAAGVFLTINGFLLWVDLPLG